MKATSIKDSFLFGHSKIHALELDFSAPNIVFRRLCAPLAVDYVEMGPFAANTLLTLVADSVTASNETSFSLISFSPRDMVSQYALTLRRDTSGSPQADFKHICAYSYGDPETEQYTLMLHDDCKLGGLERGLAAGSAVVMSVMPLRSSRQGSLSLYSLAAAATGTAGPDAVDAHVRLLNLISL